MNDSIRSATEADYAPVNEILEDDSRFHAELEPKWMTATSGITRDEFEAYIGAEDRDILVCELEGQVVGLVQLRIGQGGDPGMVYRPYGWIDEIAVFESQRGQGVGKILMAAAEDWARDLGMRMLMLDVWARNETAIALYEKSGYGTFRHRMFKDLGET